VELLAGEHIGALVATAAAAGAAVPAARRWPVTVSRGLALVIGAAYLAEHAWFVARGTWSADFNLPLHLTDVVTIVAVLALWTARPRLVELTWFWGLTASLQAVLTPDLGHGFPDPLYFTYFATHGGAVAAACLLVFGERRAPRPGAVRRAYTCTLAFACLAAAGTLLTGGNYMYLRRKPAHGSLLDVMGPWPVYIVAAGGLGLLLFAALAALASRTGRRADRRQPSAPV
jgi:hypothetical integral membrane protein (TIGR02206 family)